MLAMIRAFLVFMLMLLFSLHANEDLVLKRKKGGNLAIASVFRNEAPYLKEWIEFHRLVGVEHFYLYNNLSQDNYLSVLKPYIEAKIVELYEWPYESVDGKSWNKIQCDAFKHALNKAKKKTKWLALLDADEFLFPTQGDNLVQFLKEYERYGGVAVNWQMYGTSGVSKIHDHQLMIETLLLKARQNYGENHFVKSIIQHKKVRDIKDPHKVEYKKNYSQVNSDHAPFRNSTSPHVVVDKIRINHYWSRDLWYFVNFKCARRQKWQEGPDGQILREANLNAVYDDTILRFVPELRKRMVLELIL